MVTTSWRCCIGSSAYTWSDVEIALIGWLKESNLRDQIAGYLEAGNEERERADLADPPERGQKHRGKADTSFGPTRYAH